jgi:hypothetical protein
MQGLQVLVEVAAGRAVDLLLLQSQHYVHQNFSAPVFVAQMRASQQFVALAALPALGDSDDAEQCVWQLRVCLRVSQLTDSCCLLIGVSELRSSSVLYRGTFHHCLRHVSRVADEDV